MNGDGKLGRCREILDTFANFGYQTQLTGPDSSHQNGPVEQPHQTIGDALRAMLTGANLHAAFWPYAFYHSLRLYNFLPHGSRVSSPHNFSVASHLIYPSCILLVVAFMSARLPHGMVVSS
jgi:hypothetical protein